MAMPDHDGEVTITEPGPVELGVRAFLSQTAHNDAALSALALSCARSVDSAPPGSRPHSMNVEALRRLLDDLRDTIIPEKNESDPFAELMAGI